MRKIPPEVPLEKVARRHQALADPIRLKILWALYEMELCPCVLKVIADVSDSKLTYHLKVLESDKLIKVRRRGNWRMYSITGEGEESLARDGTKHV